MKEDENILLMPPIESEKELNEALKSLPQLKIVELSLRSADEKLSAAILKHGIKIQQDVFMGDVSALAGDYKGWNKYVKTGVQLLQTQFPHLLQPAIDEYNRSGTFPESGPSGIWNKSWWRFT